MAGLHVDEVKADVAGQAGGHEVVVDKLLQLGVGEHHRAVARIDVEFGVQERMMVGDPRRHAVVVGRLAESAGVRELQAHEQVIDMAALLAVTCIELVE